MKPLVEGGLSKGEINSAIPVERQKLKGIGWPGPHSETIVQPAGQPIKSRFYVVRSAAETR